ncbi:Predicted N-acetyltransferase YhbS [Paraoerskovia marina]|uniref:Predicted N-acetyltransferase YhbS n=2 Tax=Paraoerskovia marina TaxID=545619 RepID=A0A1H1VJT0_9CELL|nr:Predicted N-acetyltransferase YhbS [Paraoerskovia marina]
MTGMCVYTLTTMPEQSTPEFEIRRATIGDRDAVWPLVQELPGEAPTRDEFNQSFGRLTSALGTYLVVAEHPSEGIVGHLLAGHQRTLGAGGDLVRIEEVAVLPHLRRRGVATALVRAGETWARSTGASRLGLVAHDGGDLYGALGYSADATYFSRVLD